MVFPLNLPLHVFKTLDGFLILSDTIKQRKKAEEPSKIKARISHNLIWHPVVKEMLGSSTIQNPRKELIIFCLISEVENENPGELWHPQGNGFRR